jgi:hypothetical protein
MSIRGLFKKKKLYNATENITDDVKKENASGDTMKHEKNDVTLEKIGDKVNDEKAYLEDAVNEDLSREVDEYYNQKKREYLLKFDNGSSGDVFFYQMTFKEEVSKRDFLEIMALAEEKGNRYAALYDEEFWEQHNIENFKELKTDYWGYLEEMYIHFEEGNVFVEECEPR